MLTNKIILVFRNLPFLLLSCFLLCQPVSSAIADEPAFDATVLIYHHFGVSKYPTTNVTIKQFKEQMAYLAANQYRVIPLAELVDALRNHKKLPQKAVVITVDDGYESVYRNAWPIIKSFGYPFTVFINAASIDRGFSNYMNWDEVREMHRSGVDFQDHSYSHYRMVDRPRGLDEEEYHRWMRDDLRKNAEMIYEKLGTKPRFFAIPYGEYNQPLIDEARQLGYEAVLTQDPGSVSQSTDPYLIPREPILGMEWAEINHFQEILQRVDLPIADMHPPFGAIKGVPVFYGARILHPERYVDNSLEIYVSQFGWLDSHLDNEVLIAPGGLELNRKLNRVMVRAQEKEGGRTAVRSWLLVRERGVK